MFAGAGGTIGWVTEGGEEGFVGFGAGKGSGEYVLDFLWGLACGLVFLDLSASDVFSQLGERVAKDGVQGG